MSRQSVSHRSIKSAVKQHEIYLTALYAYWELAYPGQPLHPNAYALNTRMNRGEPIDFHNMNLDNASLNRSDRVMSGVDLTFARFTACTFCNVNLSNTKLRFANFWGSQLSHTDFQCADLSGVMFTRCDLQFSNLSGTNLSGANLTGANLTGAQFEHEIMTAWSLFECTMSWSQSCWVTCHQDFNTIKFV